MVARHIKLLLYIYTTVKVPWEDNGSIYGPPADKRDLTTFCFKLTNMHLKSVKNHNFLLSFKDGSLMRDA